MLTEGGRAISVELVHDGHRHTAHAACEVVLCAGAVGTPQSLQLSGIGPGALLQRHGIAGRHDLPGVATLNTLANSWLGKVRIAAEYALTRSEPMSMAPSQLGCFTRSSPAHRWPNLEYHVQPLSLDAFGEPLHRFDAFTASVCSLNPTARGTVQIRSPRPAARGCAGHPGQRPVHARRGPPSRRRQRDAAHHPRQHQCADLDDRRAGGGGDADRLRA